MRNVNITFLFYLCLSSCVSQRQEVVFSRTIELNKCTYLGLRKIVKHYSSYRNAKLTDASRGLTDGTSKLTVYIHAPGPSNTDILVENVGLDNGVTTYVIGSHPPNYTKSLSEDLESLVKQCRFYPLNK